MWPQRERQAPQGLIHASGRLQFPFLGLLLRDFCITVILVSEMRGLSLPLFLPSGKVCVTRCGPRPSSSHPCIPSSPIWACCVHGSYSHWKSSKSNTCGGTKRACAPGSLVPLENGDRHGNSHLLLEKERLMDTGASDPSYSDHVQSCRPTS